MPVKRGTKRTSNEANNASALAKVPAPTTTQPQQPQSGPSEAAGATANIHAAVDEENKLKLQMWLDEFDLEGQIDP
jgi:hypothetical protein